MIIDSPEEKRVFVVIYEKYRYLMMKVAHDVKVTLQKKVSGSWVYVQSWESSGSGRNATIAETYSVSRGTYRVVALIKAGTESKSPISAERTY